MADTFKGIITADGKKRQLPYGSVLETPVADKTLDIEGAFADSKVVGDNFKKTKTETDSLKEDIANLTESIPIEFENNTYVDLSMNVGETVNLTKTSHELFRSAVVDCNGGDIFFINALGGTAPKTFAYLDSDNKLIYKHNYEAENLVVKVTSDTRKVVINDRKTGWAGINYHGYLPRKLSDIQSILDKFVIGGINITSNSILGDADNAELNVKYFLSVPIDNTPETYGSLITIGGDVNYCIQLFGGATSNSLYYRTKWRTWRTWNKVNKEENEYFDFSLIRKFGVVGDSYASGEVYWKNSDNTYSSKDKYSISWGQILARKHGNTCTNYSKGGLSTRTWLTSDKGLSNVLASEPEDIYLLVLGINDYYGLGESYLGSLTDITNHSSYTEYADTFYGNYGKIIEQIKEHAPNCRMIIFTVASNDIVPQMFNEAIENIASHYSIPCIKQSDDVFFASDVYTNMVQGHPRALGYVGMSSAFDRLITKCVNSNYNYFAGMFMNGDD